MWQDQGRQYHMWFGHGTAGPKDKLPKSGTEPMFEPANVGRRINTVAHGALMHMPRKDWHQPVLSFDRQRLEQVRTAMAAWIGARSLSNAAFEAKLVDPLTSGFAINALRAAAKGAQTAQSHEDLKDASGHLAAGMQGVGLGRWLGFLRGAAERAEAYQPSNSRIVLAQAATTTATDASSGGSTGEPSSQSNYVASNPEQWAGRLPVGTGECVPLIQQATGAPRSTQWMPGEQVQNNTRIPRGAAIATFDGNGHYTGHAAIYLGQDSRGIQVIDQWNNRQNGRITSQHSPQERTIRFNNIRGSTVDQGERYHVVR